MKAETGQTVLLSVVFLLRSLPGVDIPLYRLPSLPSPPFRFLSASVLLSSLQVLGGFVDGCLGLGGGLYFVPIIRGFNFESECKVL